MSGRIERSALTPWAGLAAGSLAWIVHHQLGSDAVYWDCRIGGPVLTAGLGLLCLLFTLAGGWIAWAARRPLDEAKGRPETRRFAAHLSLAGAGLFGLAIVFQSLSGFLIPRCYA